MASKLDKLMDSLKASGVPISYASEIKPGIECITTGSLLFDHAIGIPGYPKGKITELFGNPSAGKTLLLYAAMAEVTKRGQIAVNCDAEGNCSHTELSEWRQAFGMDMTKVIDIEPQPAEDMINQVLDIIKATGDELGIIGVDSTSALTSDKMLEKRAGEGYVPDNPRFVNQLCRLLTVTNKHAAVIMISHIMANIGSLSPLPIAKGGHGVKHFSSLRIEVSGKPIVDSTDTFGFAKRHELNMKVVKNKCGRPGGRALKVMFDFDRGAIDTADEMITLAVENSNLTHIAGGYYVLPNGEKIRGRDKIKEMIYSDKQWHDWFMSAATNKAIS